MDTNVLSGELDVLLNEQQAAEFLGLSVHFLQARRSRGGGPVFIKISRRAIRYRKRDLIDWTEARRRISTSDNGSAA